MTGDTYERIVVLKNPRSRSAVRLLRSLRQHHPRVSRINVTGPLGALDQDTFYINWGVSRWVPRAFNVTNYSAAVNRTVNKATSLNMLSHDRYGHTNVCVISSTTNKAEAMSWLIEDGLVVARTVLRGHSGEGLVLIRSTEEWVDAPLYTRYFPSNREYRVHFYGRSNYLITQKRRPKDSPAQGDDSIIRTHGRGWVFTHNNLTCDNKDYRYAVAGAAIESASLSDLQHGAVDIIVNDKRDNPIAKVVEINTAPALESPTTLEWYTSKFLTSARRRWRMGRMRW